MKKIFFLTSIKFSSSSILIVNILILVSCSSYLPVSKSIWDGQDQILLYDFESESLPSSVEVLNAKSNLTKSTGVTSGDQALYLVLKGDEKNSGISLTPNKPWNTSKLDGYSLVFDATNETDISAQIFVTVENNEGQSLRRTGTIHAGKSNTFYFILGSEWAHQDNGLRDDPPPWQTDAIHMNILGLKYPMDFKMVASIKIFTEHNFKDKVVILDNIRFVSNPPRDPQYLTGIVDKFGQNAKMDFPLKVSADEELKQIAREELKMLAVSEPMPDRSKYGGWKHGPKLNSTGYFRTEKVGDRWALVDPEGYLFFSTGIANVRMANTTTFTGKDYRDEKVRYIDPNDVTPEDSKGIVTLTDAITSTSYNAYPERSKMFLDLPAYDDPLANHYSYRRTSHYGPIPHGETYSFYQANLERRYGEKYPGSYINKWRDVTIDRMQNWGFTSFGNWAALEFYHAKRFPYFANGWIIGDFQTVSSGFDYWGPLPDVFDPEFRKRAQMTVDVIAEEVLNTNWCIGVFIDNEKSWGKPGSIRDHYGIVLDALTKDVANSYIKKTFTKILKEKYRNIDRLNDAWDVQFKDWRELELGVNYKAKQDFSDEMVSDFSILLETYATRYFEVVHNALEDKLPNHLYMGCRFASWGMVDEVRQAAIKYVDVFSYNYYEEAIGKKYWTFLEDIDKPSIIGEFHMGALDAGLFHPGLIHAESQSDRGRMFKNYMQRVIDNPYFVGAHWFQYTDSPVTGRAHDGENYNVGFVTNTDIPYPEMVKAAKEINEELYSRRYGYLVESKDKIN